MTIKGNTLSHVLMIFILSIHHLDNKKLYKNIYTKLNKYGCFINLNQFIAKSEEINNLYNIWWYDYINNNGIKIETIKIVQESINAPIIETYMARDMLILLETEKQIKDLEVDIEKIKNITECFAFIITASSSNSGYDFVSRLFAPNAGINEDPVTGSSHSTLIPFWAKRLNKSKLVAKQLSKRGGTLYCENTGNRVKISGKAKLYLEGEIKM